MRRWLETCFGFSRNEYNGLIVLLVLIVSITAFPYTYSLFKSKEVVTEAELLAAIKLALIEKQKIAQQASGRITSRYPIKKKSDLFFFDPNTIDQTGWEQLGLSTKQAQAILKYRKAGGYFKRSEDLRKMYTISKAQYSRLSPYVHISTAVLKRNGFEGDVDAKPAYQKPVPAFIELNGADTAELDRIKGIGQTFARRIVTYRERIGGFYKKEQLMEVFGLDSAKYIEIKGQVWVDLSRLKKINVNIASVEDFRGHPYLRYKQVNALIEYRKQHGNYSNIADLKKVIILNQETINRLAPYLEF